MNIRKILCLLLLLTLLALCSCDLIPASGTQSIKVDNVNKIVITNGIGTGNTFTVENRDSIRTIINYVNGYTLENGSEPWNGWHYNLSILDANDTEIMCFTIVSEASVTANGKTYAVNAKKLLQTIEKLECDTMTDEELLDTLFSGNYFDGMTITNEDGDISIDKILALKDDYPVLFELISRPSAVESMGTYGMDVLKRNLNSADEAVRKQAEEMAEVLKNFFPNLRDKFNEILQK